MAKESRRTIENNNVSMDQILNFNDQYSDDMQHAIFDDDDITSLRDFSNPVEERRCNNIMIATILTLTVLCIFVAGESDHYIEKDRGSGIYSKDERPDSSRHSNLRPYGSDFDMQDGNFLDLDIDEDGLALDERNKGDTNEAIEDSSYSNKNGDGNDSVYQSFLPPYGSELKNKLDKNQQVTLTDEQESLSDEDQINKSFDKNENVDEESETGQFIPSNDEEMANYELVEDVETEKFGDEKEGLFDGSASDYNKEEQSDYTKAKTNEIEKANGDEEVFGLSSNATNGSDGNEKTIEDLGESGKYDKDDVLTNENEGVRDDFDELAFNGDSEEGGGADYDELGTISDEGKTEYPEFVVEKKEDPLYPDRNSPLYPYRQKEASSMTQELNTTIPDSNIDGSSVGSQSYSNQQWEINATDYDDVIPQNDEYDQAEPEIIPHSNKTSNGISYASPDGSIKDEDSPTDVNESTTSTSVNLDASLKYKFGDVKTPFVPSLDIPFFWYIPRTAGSSLETMLTRCHKLVAAGNKGAIGGAASKEVLEVVEPFPGEKYVNVEFRTEVGIQRAIDLNVIGSGLVDVVVASRLNQVKNVFHPPTNQARCFTMMRHPVDRAVSLFYYLKDAAHEQSYNKEMTEMTIDEYVKSSKAESDWMTRSLGHKLQGGRIGEDDLMRAKDFLRTKCLIGLTSKFSDSYRRIEAYFEIGSSNIVGCENKIMGELARTTKGHPKVYPGSETWLALEKLNINDMKLYTYAVSLFEEQRQMFQ